MIDGLDGEPGVRSARFLRPDATYPERFAAIFGRLSGPPEKNRAARFVCALAVADAGRHHLRSSRHRRRRDRPRGSRLRRVRLRPDLLLPAVRARRSPRSPKTQSSPSLTAARRFVRWHRGSPHCPPRVRSARLILERLSSAKRSSLYRVQVWARNSDSARLTDHECVGTAASTGAMLCAPSRIELGVCHQLCRWRSGCLISGHVGFGIEVCSRLGARRNRDGNRVRTSRCGEAAVLAQARLRSRGRGGQRRRPHARDRASA